MNPFYILLIIFSSALVPYLLGSIDFAIIVCKIVAGKDIRDYGSGNAGLTNVLRVFGKDMPWQLWREIFPRRC